MTVIPVSIYKGQGGDRIINVEHDHEVSGNLAPPVGHGGGAPHANPYTVNGSTVTVKDLIEAGIIEPNEPVEFVRPMVGAKYTAVILPDGQFSLEDGAICRTPSRAAMQAANTPSYDGWHAWRVIRLGGTKLHELRQQFIAGQTFATSTD